MSAPVDPPAHAAGPRIGRGLVATLAAATLTSWLQFAAVAFRREVLGTFSWKWQLRDQIFLSSAGYLLLFAGAGLISLAVHLLWPRRYSFAAHAGTLAGLGAFCVLLVFERIAWLAWLVVAVGLGLQVGRRLRVSPSAGWRWTWRIALVGHLATTLVVVASGHLRRAGERRAMAELPAPHAGAPNVLLIVMDTERAGSMSLYGAVDSTTPFQEELGRHGVVFDAAYSTAPWTLPSHASMFTGKYASQAQADWLSPLDETDATLAEVFRDHGYATGGFVANVNYTGFQTGLARGFLHYADTKRSLRESLLGTTLGQSESATNAMTTWDETRWVQGTARALWPLAIPQPYALLAHDPIAADEVTAQFLSWLHTQKPGRPFFAFLNLFDAHAPYLPPSRYRTMFDPAGGNEARYKGAIRYLDETLNDLLRELDRRGLLTATILVITSDHGELFGEHGRWGHGNELYRPLLHVPLVVLNAPGARPGTRVRQSISLRDLAATVLDLAAVPNTARIGGTSLRPLLAGADTVLAVSPVLSEISRNDRPGQKDRRVPSALKSLVLDSAQIITSASGSLRMFAFPVDTAEVNDLAVSPAVRLSAVDLLRRTLAAQGLTWKRGADR